MTDKDFILSEKKRTLSDKSKCCQVFIAAIAVCVGIGARMVCIKRTKLYWCTWFSIWIFTQSNGKNISLQ